MYSTFKVKKQTGTYSDAIEAFGLANLLNEIQSRAQLKHRKIWIEDKGLYYELTSKPEININHIDELKYFPFFKYVKRNTSETIDEDYFDYPKQHELKKERTALIQKAYSEFAGKEKALQLNDRLKAIEKIYTDDKYISPQLDVYSQIITPNNFVGFDKLYKNISLNKEVFPDIVKAILNYYSEKNIELSIKSLVSFDNVVTALQFYNPTTGKGLNKSKASGGSTGSVKLNWISETMKISGAISNMLCQLVKVGSSYDLKIVVPDFRKVEFTKQEQIVLGFKKNIKGNTPLKVDILNLLIVIKQLIVFTEEYKNFKAKNVLNGINSTYQKDLGQNKAVVNIAELQTPKFIEFNTEDEAKDWEELLNEQISIIGTIEELGSATQGLIAYRTFLTSSHFPSWAKFIFWYSEYVMSRFSKSKYAIPFKTNSLNKLLNNTTMNDFKISEIITNDGFQKVASAIRNSTVVLQGLKSRGQKIEFEIRYGVAQELQNKSRTKADLAVFIGDFIGTYNAETARKAEINKAYRKPVRDNELNQFYEILDNHSPKVVGALLASYGFALTEKERTIQPEDIDFTDETTKD